MTHLIINVFFFLFNDIHIRRNIGLLLWISYVIFHYPEIPVFFSPRLNVQKHNIPPVKHVQMGFMSSYTLSCIYLYIGILGIEIYTI